MSICTIDIDKLGKSQGRINITHSSNLHGFGVIPTPITVIKSGDGPTVVLTAGTHGDEYEGIITLKRLVHELDVDDVFGRLIIIPVLNYSATLEGRRRSTTDYLDLNRSLPGDPLGSPTQQIAHFVETELFSRADFAMDIHSGGTNADYVACSFVYDTNYAMEQKIAASRAFGAPFGMVVPANATGGSLSAGAERQNVVMVAAELGGGKNLQLDAYQIGYRGVLQTLHHWNVLKSPGSAPPTRETVFIRPHSKVNHIYCPCDGVFEAAVEKGSTVRAGQSAGQIHELNDLGRPPIPVTFPVDGIASVRRATPLVKTGDHLYRVAEVIENFSNPSQ